MEKVKENFIGTFDMDEVEYVTKKYGAKHPTLISLFSGCGGAALGFAQAGYEVRVMVEWEKGACDTLRANWTKKGHEECMDRHIADTMKPETLKVMRYKDGSIMRKAMTIKERDETVAELVKWKKRKHWGRWMRSQKREPAIMQVDITKVTTAEILAAAGLRVGEAFCLEGGFPCQGFSVANGNRDGKDFSNDKRNFLYLECVRVIREALPQTFMLENVPGLISMEGGRVLRMICEDLAKCGYAVSWQKLNAADYGVPQNRKRIFIIGDRQDAMVFGKERPQLHMGGIPGRVTHPDWFLKNIR